MADLRYDSKRNVRLHCCNVFLWIVNMYKQVMFIRIQFAVDIRLCNMMTIIFSTVDNRYAIQFKLVSWGWADLWQIILQQSNKRLLSVSY